MSRVKSSPLGGFLFFCYNEVFTAGYAPIILECLGSGCGSDINLLRTLNEGVGEVFFPQLRGVGEVFFPWLSKF